MEDADHADTLDWTGPPWIALDRQGEAGLTGLPWSALECPGVELKISEVKGFPDIH